MRTRLPISLVALLGCQGLFRRAYFSDPGLFWVARLAAGCASVEGMTVMLGLPQRLGATRLLVIVQAGSSRRWPDIVRALPPQCGAVILASQHGVWQEAASQRVLASWPSDLGGRLLGVDVSAEADDPDGPGRRLAEAMQPDLVIERAPTPGWPHQWALHGAHCSGTVAAGVDFCLIDPGSPGPVGKPGFAVVDDIAGAGTAIAAGATRLAWRLRPLSWWSRTAATRRGGEDMAKAAGLLQDAWRRANPEAAAQVDRGWRGRG